MKTSTRFLLLTLFAVAIAALGSAQAADRAVIGVQGDGFEAQIRFGKTDRGVIREYYATLGRHGGLPPGLAKKGKVPPGHAKRLARNQPLPRGVRYELLPRTLEARLAPLPQGFIHINVGGEFAILNSRTGITVDVFNLLD
jgi:hypothetical protein